MIDPEPPQELQAVAPPVTRKRRQEAAFTDVDRAAPIPQAKRVSRATSRPSTGGRVKKPAQTAPAPVAVRARTTKPKVQAVRSSSSSAAKPPSARSKLEDYHPDSHTLVPMNGDKTKYVELRCCYCGGNTANHTEKRHMRGAKGLQMHLNQVHGHHMPLTEVAGLTTFREVPLQEIKKLEESVKRGGTTHIEFLQSQRNGPGSNKHNGPGGWLPSPALAGAGDVAMGFAAGTDRTGAVVVSDDYDVPKSDSAGPVTSALHSTLNKDPAGLAANKDGAGATSATELVAGKLKATNDRRSMEL